MDEINYEDNYDDDLEDMKHGGCASVHAKN